MNPALSALLRDIDESPSIYVEPATAVLGVVARPCTRRTVSFTEPQIPPAAPQQNCLYFSTTPSWTDWLGELSGSLFRFALSCAVAGPGTNAGVLGGELVIVPPDNVRRRCVKNWAIRRACGRAQAHFRNFANCWTVLPAQGS